jgi:restriction system protein
MPIPDYQTLMLPLLKFLSDEKEHNLPDATKAISDEYNLSPAERQQLLPSGQQTVIRNRLGWARTYMAKAGLIKSTRRAFWQITSRGKEILSTKPDRIDVHFLQQFPEFLQFKDLHHEKEQEVPTKQADEYNPEEALDRAHQRLRENLESDLLQQVKAASAVFFENLVVQLLVRMGYGGNLQDAGRAVGQSGDGGIDGIIKEDQLGLDVIYIQAKRWENTVGRPEIQKFAGALQGHRARKGVFITTSDFSKDAIDYVERIDSKIVLIDGESLAKFMVERNVGVSTTQTIEVKRIDQDYFIEE